MKKFAVSKACNACGECMIRTDLLIEDESGFAVPVADKYIRDSDLLKAEKTAALCPMKALSIVESTTTVDLDALPAEMVKLLNAVKISDICRSEIEFKKEDYSIHIGYDSNEGRFEYSSRRSAESAGESNFEHIFWNHRQDYALSVLTQYKSKFLRPYYDFENITDTYYAKISRKIETILSRIKAESMALTNGRLCLPDDFTKFCPETDQDFQSCFAIYCLKDTDGVSYVQELLDRMERDKDNRRSHYTDQICSNEHVKVVGKNWLGDKTKTTYNYINVNKLGRRLADNILHNLDCCSVTCNMRCVDDFSTDNVNSAIDNYRQLAKKEMDKKVQEFEAAVRKYKDVASPEKQFAADEIVEPIAVVQKENIAANSIPGNAPVSLLAADKCVHYSARYSCRLFAETSDYICFYRDDKEFSGFCCIHKQSGEEVSVPYKNDARKPEFHACARGNYVYFFVRDMFPLGNKKARKIEVLDVEGKRINSLPQDFDARGHSVKLSVAGNYLLIFISGDAWWIDLQNDFHAFKIEMDFEILDTAACDGRILLIGASGNTIDLYWYDPIKNETTVASKNLLFIFGGQGILPIKYDSEEWKEDLAVSNVRRVRDQLFLIFEASDLDDKWLYLCKMDFSESVSPLQVIDTAITDVDEFHFVGEYIVKYCKAEDDADDEFRAFAIFNVKTLDWVEIPHSAGNTYSLYGDYLYKNNKYRTKLFSNYLWEKI